MTRRAAQALAACAALTAAPANAASDAWSDPLVLHLARTQVALEECPDFEADWARREMPKSSGRDPREIDTSLAAVLPAEREKLKRETGSKLCAVLYEIFGPEGSVPFFLKRR